MKNKNALTLASKIQKEISSKSFDITSVVDDLKKIREYSAEDQNPVLNKAIRLAFEHIESNKAFLIGIPFEEQTEENENDFNFSETNDLESFSYFIALIQNLDKKNNLLDCKEYNKAFLAY